MRQDKPRMHRADANQKVIVAKLRSIPGVSVLIVGAQTFDIIVGFQGRNYMYEIKRDKKAKLKKTQDEFSKRWAGHWKRVETVEQIMDDVWSEGKK